MPRLKLFRTLTYFVSRLTTRMSAGRTIPDIEPEALLDRKLIQMTNPQVSDRLKGQVVLVTGAAGSIGSELVRQLLALHPKTIVLLDQAESPLLDLIRTLHLQHPALCTRTGLMPEPVDITDEPEMHRVFRTHRPDFVFHAAAYKHVPLLEAHPRLAVRVNVWGTVVAARLAREYRVGRFILVSTDKAVHPVSVMGASKRIAELCIQRLNLLPVEDAPTRFITTRFGNVLGSSGSVVRVFQDQIRTGGPVTVTDPQVSRYVMTIPEASQLILEAGVMGQGGEIFMFDMGRPVRMLTLARKMIALTGLRPERDIQITFTGLRPGEKMHEDLTDTHEQAIPTHHPKIKIIKPVTPDAACIDCSLQQLPTLLQTGETTQLYAWLSTLLPTYSGWLAASKTAVTAEN